MSEQREWSCEHCGKASRQRLRECDECRGGMCFECTEEHDEHDRCPLGSLTEHLREEPWENWDRGVRWTDRGPSIRLASGAHFHPFDPKPEEIEIEDIASALSKVCRFGGHCNKFYSVAQHSLEVEAHVTPFTPQWSRVALLHDATEAYVGDMVAPIKRHPCMKEYRELEHFVWKSIAERFGLPEVMPPEVKDADLRTLATESRDLGGEPFRNITPYQGRIKPMKPKKAEAAFLNRWEELCDRDQLTPRHR